MNLSRQDEPVGQYEPVSQDEPVIQDEPDIHTVSDLTPTLPTFSSKYDVVPCNFDNCKNSCIKRPL